MTPIESQYEGSGRWEERGVVLGPDYVAPLGYVALNVPSTEDTMPTPADMRAKGSVRVLLFSGSLRTDSLNTRLAHLAGSVLGAAGAIVDWATMSEFDGPSYNQDVETGPGIPAGPRELHRRLEACDAFVIATPEYNASMPGHLKNAIDWVSRIRPQPFNARHGLLLSASPSMAGGNRGLWALRIPLEHLGARIFPDMFSLAQAHKAFDEAGALTDGQLAARFQENLRAFLDLVEAATHYPCMKKAWVEFLGEPGDTVGRVEAA